MAESPMLLDDATIKHIAADTFPKADIISVRTERAVPEGEHYLSTLLRTYVKFRHQNADKETETKLIIKAHPPGVLSEMIEETSMFEKELISYNKIVPLINEILGKNVTPLRLGPVRYDILVLEDLKLKGFEMKNRVEKLDFEHAKEALKLLADFHGASILVHEKNPELFKEIKEERIYIESSKYVHSFVKNGFTSAGEEFEKVPFLRKYADRLRKGGEKVWEAVKEAVIPRKDEINVFNHGDFWTTNLLYSYDNRRHIKEVRLVDFQFCRWGSPAFDLQMLFATSLRDQNDVPKLTSIYLDRLNTHLQPHVITEESLENEMRRLDCFGFLTAICTMPICILDPNTPLNFSETTSDDFNKDFPEDRPNPYLTGLKDEGFLKTIPDFLEFYDRRGLF